MGTLTLLDPHIDRPICFLQPSICLWLPQSSTDTPPIVLDPSWEASSRSIRSNRDPHHSNHQDPTEEAAPRLHRTGTATGESTVELNCSIYQTGGRHQKPYRDQHRRSGDIESDREDPHNPINLLQTNNKITADTMRHRDLQRPTQKDESEGTAMNFCDLGGIAEENGDLEGRAKHCSKCDPDTEVNVSRCGEPVGKQRSCGDSLGRTRNHYKIQTSTLPRATELRQSNNTPHQRESKAHRRSALP